jgi:hypothetical protein
MLRNPTGLERSWSDTGNNSNLPDNGNAWSVCTITARLFRAKSTRPWTITPEDLGEYVRVNAAPGATWPRFPTSDTISGPKVSRIPGPGPSAGSPCRCSLSARRAELALCYSTRCAWSRLMFRVLCLLAAGTICLKTSPALSPKKSSGSCASECCRKSQRESEHRPSGPVSTSSRPFRPVPTTESGLARSIRSCCVLLRVEMKRMRTHARTTLASPTI